MTIREDDLFPLDLKEIATFLLEEEAAVADAVIGIANSLNYLALCAGPTPVPPVMPSRRLTEQQKVTVRHLVGAVRHLEESGQKVAPFEEMSTELTAVRFDYAGEPILLMEDLVADLVIAAWPAEGQAAVQDAVDFLPSYIKDKLNDPKSCLLPLHEWPEKPPVSKVRASDEEWFKLVQAAHKRGLMAPLQPEDVFKDKHGRPVLNGAGGVPKFKMVDGQVQKLQRFISNLIPANAFQERIDGDDRFLPYLGQLTLLEQDADQDWLVDSEDFTSCFNLFRIPPAWLPYMGFNKLVDAEAFGGPKGVKVYPAMQVLPMGWVSSVAVVQGIVRTLVFEEAQVPLLSEVSKLKPIPESDDLTVIYLDSFDELRRLERGCAEALGGQMSERHERFLKVCQEKNLPLNDGKRLVGATKGTLQGGELDGSAGRYGLASDKMCGLMGLLGSLVGQEKWSEFMLRHVVGKTTFGMCFRRPLFSLLQETFWEIQRRVEQDYSMEPSDEALDEVLLVLTLVPLMFTNLRAVMDDEIAVTDASPSGGGAAVATAFRRPDLMVETSPEECYECGGHVSEDAVYPCPAVCGAAFCSLACVLKHRDIDHSAAGECPRRTWRPPRFGERFAGRRAPLSHAVALQGHVEVQAPYDLHFGNDMFTDQGRRELSLLMEDDALVAEHWAPECKLFSRARGRPITLEDGSTIPGPQPVRDHRHLMGFPWLKSDMKARVRQSNSMALKPLKRGLEGDRKPFISVEHPYNSWLWEFTLAKEMEALPGMEYSVGSCCCFGGRREKWFAFLSDLPTLPEFLSRDCPGHQGLLGYEVTQRPDGTLVYPTEEEAEYPWELCQAYALALRKQVDLDGTFEKMVVAERELFYLEELRQSTTRLSSSPVLEAVAALLAREELGFKRGQEKAHLRSLLRAATYRGTDVRLFAEIDIEGEPQQHELPYLAMRWDWKTILAYPWKEQGHINELELNAVAVLLKRRSRARLKHGMRYFHVLDSMVTRGCLAKGRSSSPRLNRVLRRCAAYLLGSDMYQFPLWTISRWNFADKPSRLHETAS